MICVFCVLSDEEDDDDDDDSARAPLRQRTLPSLFAEGGLQDQAWIIRSFQFFLSNLTLLWRPTFIINKH